MVLNTWRGPAALASGLLALALAACGSSTGSSSSTTPLKAGESPSGQQLYGKNHGGVLKVFDHEDFEHLDPGEAYFAVDYPVIYATQRPLYSYKPNTATVLSPDLASEMPTISSDGKTITVNIRHGVRFSPPVNREVTSSDVAYAIERGANPKVSNPYFGPYFGDLVGAKSAKGGPIAGIETPSKYQIVFHLTEPTATLFAGALSLPLSAPVPPEFAKPLDAKNPTTYGTEYLAYTGPYMLKQDNSTGKFLGNGYQPGKSATLVRNPNWNASTDYRPAYLDEIQINIGGEPAVIGQQVLKGSNVVQNDSPAQSIVKEAYENYPKQITFTPGAGTYYVALNNAHGPFRSLNLRRAVWAALNREAVAKARGGSLVAQPMTHFIYPGVNGYQQSGSAAGPKFDYNEHPEGSISVAEKYIKLAGYPSGKYTGGATLQVVGSTGSPAEEMAQITNSTLEKLGFKTHLSIVEQATMYGKYCGVPKEEIDACPNVGWIRDFADPQTVLYVPFWGPGIIPDKNSNWGQVNNPQINAAMDKAALVVGEKARAEAWAKVDDMLVEQAVAAPEVFVNQALIEGGEVAGVNQIWNSGEWDYSFTSLR